MAGEKLQDVQRPNRAEAAPDKGFDLLSAHHPFSVRSSHVESSERSRGRPIALGLGYNPQQPVWGKVSSLAGNYTLDRPLQGPGDVSLPRPPVGYVDIQTSALAFSQRLRELVSALRKLRRGDFSVRLREDGTDGDIEPAMLFNEVVSLNQQTTAEFERLSPVVGKEGKIGHRAKVEGATGGWDTKLRAVNDLIDDMVQPTVEVARVIGAVAKGDLSQTMAVEIEGRVLKGEFLRIGKVVNTMVEQLA